MTPHPNFLAAAEMQSMASKVKDANAQKFIIGLSALLLTLMVFKEGKDILFEHRRNTSWREREEGRRHYQRDMER